MHGINISDDYSQDLMILIQLLGNMWDRGHFDNLELVQSKETDDAALDILVVTKTHFSYFRIAKKRKSDK